MSVTEIYRVGSVAASFPLNGNLNYLKKEGKKKSSSCSGITLILCSSTDL